VADVRAEALERRQKEDHEAQLRREPAGIAEPPSEPLHEDRSGEEGHPKSNRLEPEKPVPALARLELRRAPPASSASHHDAIAKRGAGPDDEAGQVARAQESEDDA
jgi:hypothetical protein